MGILKKIKERVLNKKKGGKEIIMEVGLAAVGVVLLVVFRDQLTTLVQTLIGNVTTEISTVFKAL